MKNYYRVTLYYKDDKSDDFIIKAENKNKAVSILKSFFEKLEILSDDIKAKRVYYIKGNYYTRKEMEDLMYE